MTARLKSNRCYGSARLLRLRQLPRNNPLYLGRNFKPFLDTSDLVLLVRSRIPWYPPSRSPRDATIVAINETPLKTFMVYQNLQADHYLERSVEAPLTMLAQAARA